MTTERPVEPQDLPWEAFRYVAGEMAEPERRQFEERLEQDEAACQAVAGAVEWTCAAAVALRSATPCVPRPERRFPRRVPRPAWFGIGLAAGLLVAVVTVWQNRPTAPATPADAVPVAAALDGESVSADLAAVWWDTWSERTERADTEPELLPPLTEEALGSWRLDPPAGSTTPEWLLSAVADTSGEDADDEEDESDADTQEDEA